MTVDDPRRDVPPADADENPPVEGADPPPAPVLEVPEAEPALSDATDDTVAAADVDADRDPDRDPDADPDAEAVEPPPAPVLEVPEPEPEPGSEPERPLGEPEPIVDDAVPGPVLDEDEAPEPEPEPPVEPELPVEPVAVPDTPPEPETEPEPDLEPETEPEPVGTAEPEPPVEPELPVEPATDPESPPEPGADPNHEPVVLAAVGVAAADVDDADDVDLDAPTALEDGPASGGPLVADADGFRSRWEEVQFAFVDAPRGAVEDADQLVVQVIDEVTARLNRDREAVAAGWRDDPDASTDDLRGAFQRYRTLFDQILTTT